MSGLVPYPGRDQRLDHVLRHYYNPHERFWDLTGEPFLSWRTAWEQLRGAGILVPDGWRQIVPGSPCDQLAGLGHERWFGQAEAAFRSAQASGQVYADPPYHDRRQYVGATGVLVVAAERDGRHFLVTCYRVVPSWVFWPAADPAPWALAAQNRAMARAGVRRSQWRASLIGDAPRENR